MKRQRLRENGTEGQRDGGTEAVARLLRRAVPPVGQGAEPTRDLWPVMQRRLEQHRDVKAALRAVPWFDWALAGGVALFAVAVPAAVPVLLYYL